LRSLPHGGAKEQEKVHKKRTRRKPIISASRERSRDPPKVAVAATKKNIDQTSPTVHNTRHWGQGGKERSRHQTENSARKSTQKAAGQERNRSAEEPEKEGTKTAGGISQGCGLRAQAARSNTWGGGRYPPETPTQCTGRPLKRPVN